MAVYQKNRHKKISLDNQLIANSERMGEHLTSKLKNTSGS